MKPLIYHRFPLIERSRIDGWVFGTITEYAEPSGCYEGDAYVQAPDGSRAGMDWIVGTPRKPRVICEPEGRQWGVYEFVYPEPIVDTDGFVEMCHTFLPQLKALHRASRAF